jgi:hypothetical protein
VIRHVGCEYGETTTNQGNGTVGMPARTPSVHLMETALETRQEIMTRSAVGKVSKVVSDSRESKNTGTTLPSALKCQVARNAGCLCDPTRGRPQHHDHADTRTSPDCAKGARIVRDSKVVRSDPSPAVSTDEKRLWRFIWGPALRDFPQRSATIDFDHSRVSHGSPDRDEARTRFFDRSPITKWSRTLSSNEGDVREGFGVVHQGDTFPDSQWGALVGSEDRNRRTGLNEVDQG